MGRKGRGQGSGGQDGQALVREQEGGQVADVREADLTCLDHWGEVSDK